MHPMRRFRERVGMSQAQLGAAIGRTQSAVAHYENGCRTPPVDTARRFLVLANSHGIKLSLDDLYPAAIEKESAA